MHFLDDLCAAPARPEHFAAWSCGREHLSHLLGVAIAPDWPIFVEALAPATTPDPEPSVTQWFGIAVRERTLIAVGGLTRAADDSAALYFGYAVAEAWRGRGHGHAFAALLRRAAFSVPGVRRLLADTLDDGVISPEGFDNRASVALLRRLGFERIRIDPGKTQRWRLAHPPIT